MKRLENGLIEGFNYIYQPDGLIDWRRTLPKEFLYINPQKKNEIEKRLNKPVSEMDISSDNLKDTDLIILLGGIKWLTRIRGFSLVNYKVVSATEDYAAVSCNIKFIGNTDTDGREVEFSDNACAHQRNTTSFTKQYLLEMATNRAFCRCVRSFLNINIVSKEEILGSEDSYQDTKSQKDQVYVILQQTMDKHNTTLEKIKAFLIKNESEQPKQELISKWTCIEDIPKIMVLALIEKINKAASIKKTSENPTINS